jgi:hypothetical protein
LFGLRASGGSLYLSTTPCRVVLVSAASSPEFPKFGFDAAIASADGEPPRPSFPLSYFLPYRAAEDAGTPASARAAFWDGKGAFERPALALRSETAAGDAISRERSLRSSLFLLRPTSLSSLSRCRRGGDLDLDLDLDLERE